MNLNHTVEVAAPFARVWALLDDLEAVIPCMPGATFLKRDGDSFEAGIKVKVGVIAMNFIGTAQVVERNEAERRVTIQGSGKDTKGKGAANATVVAELTPVDANRTSVSLRTTLALSGRIAQFGGSIINEIASRLIEQFVANLHSAILVGNAADEATAAAGASAPAPAGDPASPAAGPVPASHPAGHATGHPQQVSGAETAPLDLGALMKPVITRYALMALFAVAVFVLGFAAGRYL